MNYALMQNVLTSTNMNVRKHFIKCAIPYICIESCVVRYIIYSTYFIRGTIICSFPIIEIYICNRL